jgi:transmembrane sensor
MPLMAAACLVLLGLAGWIGIRATQGSGALAIAGADALGPSRVLDGNVASVWPLSDGSRIQLAPESRLEVLENSGDAFAMRLESGRGDFEVKPGGPRRWRIECGEMIVEVVGTSFVVDRDARGVSVEVRHGVVRVRSARIAGGMQRLAAGAHLYLPEVGLAVAGRGAASTAGGSSSGLHQAGEVALDTTAEPAVASQPSAAVPFEPSRAERRPSASRQSASVPSPAARRAGEDPAGLLRSADDARRHGDAVRAESLFERVRAGWPGTPHAALAALTLARMRMQAAPDRAAQDLTAALAADLPEGLREDAMARLVEARARAGQGELAEAAARAYRRAYPNGRRAAEIERWMRQP